MQYRAHIAELLVRYPRLECVNFIGLHVKCDLSVELLLTKWVKQIGGKWERFVQPLVVLLSLLGIFRIMF